MGARGPWQARGRRTAGRDASQRSFPRRGAAQHLATVEDNPVDLYIGRKFYRHWKIGGNTTKSSAFSAFCFVKLEPLEEFIFCG